MAIRSRPFINTPANLAGRRRRTVATPTSLVGQASQAAVCGLMVVFKLEQGRGARAGGRRALAVVRFDPDDDRQRQCSRVDQRCRSTAGHGLARSCFSAALSPTPGLSPESLKPVDNSIEQSGLNPCGRGLAGCQLWSLTVIFGHRVRVAVCDDGTAGSGLGRW